MLKNKYSDSDSEIIGNILFLHLKILICCCGVIVLTVIH